MAGKTHDDRCARCGARAPFIVRGVRYCGGHWKELPDTQESVINWMNRINEDEEDE